MARRRLGYCPGVEAAARFTSEKIIGKKTGLFTVLSVSLVILVAITYSGYTTIQMNLAREDYAKALFSDFTIIEVKNTEKSAFYRDGSFLSPHHFYDVQEFINVAHQQDINIIYRVVPSIDGYIYYYFESPIYYENYMAYEIEITPPVWYNRFGLPEIVLKRTG
ncbi:MAG: hypothetical protein NWF07_14460 [Candidatus Bathyarchaeota archaeon]|nr:hypothetical protein [Candidatus Bathyarchaeota archaeon]